MEAEGKQEVVGVFYLSTLSCFIQPFWTSLVNAEKVLVAGCSGKYNVFSGLLLCLALHQAGKHICLASLSFSHNLENVTSHCNQALC